MAINTLTYAQIFQSELDRQVAWLATTGWMEGNSSRVRYNGGNEVKIPKILMDGLADYNRDTGHVMGGVTLSWQTRTLTQDRGRRFQIDPMDVDETNFVPTAGTIMGEFQRTQVVPEIDAYRYSKLATYALGTGGNSATATITGTNAINQLLSDLAAFADTIGGTYIPAIVTLSPVMKNMLASDIRFQNLVNPAVLNQGGLDVRLDALNGNVLREAPSALLKSAFVFNDGTTAGQTAGGFTPAATARNINWIICTPDVPIAISKTDVPRIFDPMTNQKANAWSIDYRKYHDLWVPDNQLKKLFVSLAPAS